MLSLLSKSSVYGTQLTVYAGFQRQFGTYNEKTHKYGYTARNLALLNSLGLSAKTVGETLLCMPPPDPLRHPSLFKLLRVSGCHSGKTWCALPGSIVANTATQHTWARKGEYHLH